MQNTSNLLFLMIYFAAEEGHREENGGGSSRPCEGVSPAGSLGLEVSRNGNDCHVIFVCAPQDASE